MRLRLLGLTRLAFKPHLQAHLLGHEEVVVLAEGSAGVVLRGRAYAALAPLLDGTRTADELVDQVSPGVSAELAYYALEKLQTNGHVTTVPPDGFPPHSAFWHALSVNPDLANRRLAEATVGIVAHQAPVELASLLQEALAGLGVRCLSEAPGGTPPVNLAVLLVHDYLSPGPMEYAGNSDGKNPWMLLKPGGEIAAWGPIFSGQKPCWQCLRARLRENRLGGPLGGPGEPDLLPQLAVTPAAIAALSLAAADIATWIAAGQPGNHRLAGTIQSWDALKLEAETHELVPHHDCPRCFPARRHDPREAIPMVPRSLTARHSIDGGVRPGTAGAMLEKLARYSSSLTGILPAIGRLPCTGLTSIYTTAIPQTRDPRPVPPPGLWPIGKGVTDDQARVGCWMEAIELRNMMRTGNEPAFEASYASLAGRAIHPREIIRFSDRQIAERETWNRAGPRFRIPPPFDEQQNLSWTAVWSLTRQATRFVPASVCYAPHPEARLVGTWGSNGCAAGVTVEDALLHAALELIERDAVALWWYNRVPRPRLRPADLREPAVEDILRAFARAGFRVWLLDLTTEFGIPVIAAIRCDAGGALSAGFGAALHHGEAAIRALTELEQMEAMARFGPATYRERRTRTGLEEHPWIGGLEERAIDIGVPRLARNLAKDLELVFGRLQRAGLELLAHDFSRAGIDVATVRLLAPGLRHWFPHLGPGRLYDAPVALGWLDQPRREDELNGWPFWL